MIEVCLHLGFSFCLWYIHLCWLCIMPQSEQVWIDMFDLVELDGYVWFGSFGLDLEDVGPVFGLGAVLGTDFDLDGDFGHWF